MSKLEELMQELCPEEIEYKTLEKCCNILDKYRKPIAKSSRQSGDYPYYGANGIQDYVSDYIFEGEFVLVGEDGSVLTSNNTPIVNWASGKIWVNNHAHVISKSDNVLLRYLFYYLQTINIKHLIHGNIPKLTGKDFKSLTIPVPPLSVQEEIVHILDNFAELTAELTARKKQYEYYRDRLLAFDNRVPLVKLSEIALDIYRGSGIKRDEVLLDGIPCLRYGEIYTCYDISFEKCKSYTKESVVSKPKYFEYGDIIFAITGESVEEIAKSIVYLGNDKCMAGGDTVVLKHNQDPRYMAYALSTTNAQIQKSKGKVKSKVVHSSVPAIKEIKIPLPDINTQRKIADILDNFHKLCSDISEGLPAEIEARQKQYEYYRDKLLTFKPLEEEK